MAMNSTEFMARESSTIVLDLNDLILFPPDLDTTLPLSSHCPLTSADWLGILATSASLQGQSDLSLTFSDDGSLDILATAAQFAGVSEDPYEPEVDTIAHFAPSEEARGVKRKRDEYEEEKGEREEGEDVSLDDILYLSDDDVDCFDGDFDKDNDNSCLDDSVLAADDGETDYVIKLTGPDTFKVFRFSYDSDEDSDEESNDDDYQEEEEEDSDDDDDDDSDISDSESDDSETDLDSSGVEDDTGECPPSCVCWTGSPMELYSIDRRYPVISPLYKKLLQQRLLRSANRYRYDCCERRCSFRWRKRPLSKMTSDYKPSDLRVYNFRWGTWKPDDEEDEIFW